MADEDGSFDFDALEGPKVQAGKVVWKAPPNLESVVDQQISDSVGSLNRLVKRGWVKVSLGGHVEVNHKVTAKQWRGK